jgi:hypothetical protein
MAGLPQSYGMDSFLGDLASGPSEEDLMRIQSRGGREGGSAGPMMSFSDLKGLFG